MEPKSAQGLKTNTITDKHSIIWGYMIIPGIILSEQQQQQQQQQQ